MLSAWISLFLLLAPTVAGADCSADRAEMLSLGETAFDQGDGGWRSLAKRECYREAANLIRDYRQAHSLESQTISWMHEAQMRAYAGDYAGAVLLLPKAKHKMDGHGWNAYLDATIAFLNRDRAALVEARNRLAGTPLPHTHQWLFDDKGQAVDVPAPDPGDPWPPNLNIVDALVRCFDRSYSEAYGSQACYSD